MEIRSEVVSKVVIHLEMTVEELKQLRTLVDHTTLDFKMRQEFLNKTVGYK